MQENMRILVVDDDPNICELVKLYLEKEGAQVTTVQRGDAVLQAIADHAPEMILLDIMLPGMDGWQVLREVRRDSSIPIIMLTAKGETFDKVLGLELGADDYMVKPFDPQELIARIKAIVRRTQPQEERKQLRLPNLTIDMSTYMVQYHERQLEMPPKEMELLFFLADHAGKVFTREQLLEQVWGFDYFGDSRTVDVHVKRLREKFTHEDDGWYIKTVWGVGYKLEVK